jgi:hypothetical protein
MKRKAYRKARARIRRLADKWVGPLGLKWWTIEQCYYDSSDEYAAALDCDATSTVATCVSDWRYRTARISFNLPLWKTLTDAEAEHHYVHELCHLFLAELQHDADDRQAHVERVCQTLADAFLWVKQGVKA